MHHPRFIRAAFTALIATAALALPVNASALTVVSPAAGAHVEWFQLRPIVAFDPAQGEKPKWVLLASDAEMKSTVRYCRQFVGVNLAGGYHWGCNGWSIGVDAFGQDIQKPLETNKTYYFQVVYTVGEDAAEKTTATQGFTIDNMPQSEDPSAIAEKIWDETIGDGTNLNLGTAAFTNSALRPKQIHSTRVKRNRFRILVSFQGAVDMSRSYVKIKSGAGTRYVKLVPYGANQARAVWIRNRAEQRLKVQKYSYQGFLRSTKNGAMVRTEQRVILVKTNRKARRHTIPAWTPI